MGARPATPERAADVAIVGMSVLLPGAADLDAYWRNLVEGVDAVTEVPADRWDPAFYDPEASGRADRVYCRRGGFVTADFTPAPFGIMPTSVPDTEPDQLVALRVAAAAIDDAGGPDRLPARDRVGVILGRGGYLTPGLVRLDQRVRTANQLVHTLAELLPDLGADQLDRVRDAFADRLGPTAPEAAIGLVPNLAASRVANRLDLRGPAYTVDAACASSLVAVDQAVTELATGRCDAVLAGGVHHCHDITLWSVFSQLRALSRAQRIRPFDQRADGILIGEGTGVVVLKRLADALRDDDRVYAVIRGTGVASDGRAASLFNPEPGGQARAVRRAWDAAGLDPAAPDALGLLEAHGTGTPAGDLAELATLADVFGPAGEPAVIGSVKSMIGHTMPAAGVAGLVKAALAVHRAVLLPTLHCEQPRAELAGTRFRPIATARPWEAAGPRRAGVNAFGFGGINAHVVVEQAPVPVRRAVRHTAAVTEPERVLRFAAPTPAALADLLAADDATLRAAARTPGGGAGSDTGPVGCRLGIVAPTTRKLALARRIADHGQPWRGRSDIWFSPAPLLTSGRLAYVFPGLEAEFAPRVADVAARLGVSGVDGDASGVGRHGVGVVALGRLMEQALRRMAVTPDAVAGHSVGEWTAMASAGVHDPAEVDRFLVGFDPDALRVPGVVFAAIGAGAARVGAALAGHPDVVLSHDNAPNQSIVCGPASAVDDLVRTLRAANVVCQVLPFRSGFHTPMLVPYLEPIRAAADRFTIRPSRVPLWSATTAAPYPSTPDEVRALFVRHLVEPVRFRPLIEAMYAAGIRVFVQMGTGQLAALVGDILHGRDHLAVATNAAHHDGLAQLRRVACALWVEGARPDAAFAESSRPDAAGAGSSRPHADSTGTPAPDDAAAGPERPRGASVRLALGGALVSLGTGAADLRPVPAGPREPAFARLHALAGRTPSAADLAELLHDTAETAVAVLEAASSRPAPAGPVPAGPTAAGPVWPAGRHETVLRVGLDTMPYLRDHCFFRQRDGWPDDTDRWPVVPATTVVAHMMAAAERLAPGLRAVAVHEARFNRWVVAAPPAEVPVIAVADGTARVTVTFGGYAQAVIELGRGYPAAPGVAPLDQDAERPPAIRADQLYTDRWMFHGPAFQGVTELLAIAADHVRGVLTAPPAPGALLDNVGQLLGYWIMASHTTRRVVFPVGMRRIAFHGPVPAPGTRLECRIAVRSVTDGALTADAQLVHDGQVWCDIAGWTDRRFDSHPDTHAVERFADRNTLSRAQPEGWALVFERWPDLASRDLVMRTYLNADERADHDRCPARVRRQWLLGRIAAKDAVRHHVWRTDDGPVFPAEIRVSNQDSGRPVLRGQHGYPLPPLTVSLAHRAEAGVAVVGTGPVGIDIEEVAPRPAGTLDVALTPAERDRLTGLGGGDLWFTRFWAAKEAVAKAEGTGLAGQPRRFVVTAAGPDALTVVVAGRTYPVRHTVVHNPGDLPAREYVVAWTRGPDNEETA